MNDGHVSRRTMLKQLGAAAMLPLFAGCEDQTPAAFFEDKMIGVQLYTVRSLFKEDYQSTLKALADIGYQDLEFARYYGHEPKDVKALMDDLGLISRSSHIQLAQMRNDFGTAIDIAGIMGQTNLIIPWLAPEERTVDGYKAIAALLNKRGEEAKKAGMRVAYHNHDFEFETVDGQVPYDILLSETHPDLVSMELDLFWVVQAGLSPLDLFDKAPGRFIACHIKDRTHAGEMTDVGSGTIDFKAILAQFKQAGFEGFYVEHDNPPGDPLASVTKSFAHLTTL